MPKFLLNAFSKANVGPSKMMQVLKTQVGGFDGVGRLKIDIYTL